ncbi:periplasmic heavy metal sensor [Chenggangzhangella methanolivorans]|nr:periplasmic heavy metal sensor [Chenggangzhangella methanolivorans]
MRRRPHGLVYALLAVSLAVNLIGAGYFLGAGFADYRSARHGKPPRTVESTIDYVAGRYPAPVAAKVRAKLEAKRPELSTAFDEMRLARRETRKAIKQQPLDKARIEAAFAASRDKAVAFQQLIQSAIIEALPDLPESERNAIEKDDDPD